MKPKIYGEISVGTNPLPVASVGHIQGGLLQYDFAGKPAALVLHHVTPEGPNELRLSFGDAMFLLSMLKAIQLDHNIPFPDDPRAT